MSPTSLQAKATCCSRTYQSHSSLYLPYRALRDARGSSILQSFVGEDGRLHLVGDAESLAAAMQELDLNQAHVLSRLDTFWSQRCRWDQVSRQSSNQLLVVTGQSAGRTHVSMKLDEVWQMSLQAG